MKNALKISILAVVATIFVAYVGILGLPPAHAQEKTLVDYLNNKNVSFLIVNGEKMTTFGQKSAADVCKDIKNAGFSIKTVRNYTEVERKETFVSCN